MKRQLLMLLLFALTFAAKGQTATVTESLRPIDSSVADVMYNNEFGSFRNPDLDDPFPYAVIRIELSGDVAKAKTMLSLDLGTMYKVEARNINKNNMILFLVRSSVRSIHLVCGDGCDRQELYYGNLIMNRVYTCNVEYTAAKQEAGSSEDIAEMKRKMEEMQQMLQNINDSQQESSARSGGKRGRSVETTRYSGVDMYDGVLRKVPDDFHGAFVVGEDCQVIGNSAFYGCKGLTSVAVSGSVNTIRESAFKFCTALATVTLPEGLTIIDRNLFYGCTALAGITIPASVACIEKLAFKGCNGLTEITIPNSVTTIGNDAFSECRELTSVNLSKGLRSIGLSAFSGCRVLSDITLPSTLRTIGASAFYDCRSLASVEIPKGVTSIEYRSFEGCTGLTTITLPTTLTNIGASAFNGCTALRDVTIPEGVTYVGNSAFSNTGLTTVTLPASVTMIGDNAFAGCRGLASVIITNGNVVIGKDAFAGCGSLTAIHVPAEYRKQITSMLPKELRKLIVQ